MRGGLGEDRLDEAEDERDRTHAVDDDAEDEEDDPLETLLRTRHRRLLVLASDHVGHGPPHLGAGLSPSLEGGLERLERQDGSRDEEQGSDDHRVHDIHLVFPIGNRNLC